jgi:hypothetical protein
VRDRYSSTHVRIDSNRSELAFENSVTYSTADLYTLVSARPTNIPVTGDTCLLSGAGGAPADDLAASSRVLTSVGVSGSPSANSGISMSSILSVE